MQNEKSGRFIFYGAMIGEGIIALIWCTLGLSFYDSTEALNATMANGGPAAVVHEVSTSLLGTVGGILAILGVVILPITSGDTAFRSARLIVADFLKVTQKPLMKRLLQQDKGMDKVTPLALRLTATVMLCACVTMALIGEWLIIILFGVAYQPAYPALLALLLALLPLLVAVMAHTP